jgi:hypothetical protein
MKLWTLNQITTSLMEDALNLDFKINSNGLGLGRSIYLVAGCWGTAICLGQKYVSETISLKVL